MVNHPTGPAADRDAMARAIELADTVRTSTSPNPWVGCVIEPGGFEGATQPPGGSHAEIVALDAADRAARGSTLFVTLEPCSHHGRTPPCVDAIIEAGVSRVVVGIEDPDPQVSGTGIARLREAGIDVKVGVSGIEVTEQLRAYLHHRRTGRPFVVLKMAATLDGKAAAPDSSSRWITGHEARADAHRLRSESDVVMIGAGTVRADDPALTVRHVEGPDPARVVLGEVPEGAKVEPAESMAGDLESVLAELGAKGVLQVMVEGGPTTAGAFHRAGLVDEYVLYLAPALMGGDDGRSVLGGPGAMSMDHVWRGELLDVVTLGHDVRVRLRPRADDAPPAGGGA